MGYQGYRHLKLIALLLLHWITSNCFAQTDSTRSNGNTPVYRPNYNYQHRMHTLYFKSDHLKFSYAYNGGHSLFQANTTI